MHRIMKLYQCVLMFTFIATLASGVFAEEYVVKSPNGQIAASFYVQDGAYVGYNGQRYFETPLDIQKRTASIQWQETATGNE